MREQLHVLLNDEGKSAYAYGRVMTALIILSLIPLCFKEPDGMLLGIEYLCVSVFIVDYIARWVTADLKLGKGALSFLIYPFTPMAIVDLVTILPTFVMLNPAFKAARVLRLFRALRAFKLIRYSKSVDAIASAFVKQKQLLMVVLALAVMYVFVCALVVFNVEPDTFETFFDALYWAVVSLTTVGYGDLYPTTEVGRTVAMISSFAGIAVVALPAGILTAGLMNELAGKGAGGIKDDQAAPESDWVDGIGRVNLR